MNIAEFFLQKGFLISPDLFNEKDNEILFFDENEICTNELIIDKLNHVEEKENTNYKENTSELKLDKKINGLKIVRCYRNELKKRDVTDFVSHFRYRFNFLKNILLNREELQNTISINKLLDKKNKENTSIIGFVRDKRINKTGSIILTLEDLTGEVSVLFNKNLDFLDSVKDVVLDEVVGVSGFADGNFVYASKIFFPDVPLTNEFKKYDKEEYIVFTSDVHVGNKIFFEKNFSNFIKWLNLDYGNENQRKIAEKVKYVFFVGDLVDGIGVYPDQEDDLAIKDIHEQYEIFANYINSIRKDIIVVLICGNHDAVRLSEPQPVLDKKIAPLLYKNENVIFTTNPSIVNILSDENFSGFNILMYHGFSFPYYSEEVDSVRRNGRLDGVDLIMKFLLQRRHMAPTHGCNTYVPTANEDHLIIDIVPDFFVSGHIHKTNASNYRGVTMLNCGCWIGQTEDQEKRGIIPDPNRIIAVNLQTRDIKILNFEE